MIRPLVAAAGVLLLCAAAGPASAQLPAPGQIGPQPGQTVPDPQRLQAPQRAPLTLTPSITVTEEFNDNIFLDNDNKVYDFITGFTPGIELRLEDPLYRVLAAYNFTAELFARNPEENHAFDRQNFLFDSLYRVTPQLTLTLDDNFTFSTDTNLISAEGVSTGRDRSWSNTLAGTAAYQVDPFTTLRGGGSWSVQRFKRRELQESDVYRADVGLERAFSPRLRGLASYQFGYFDIEEEPTTYTHTPRLGVTYQFTETISASLSAGPTFELRNGDDSRVTPAVTASYAQRTFFGSVALSYDRSVSTAGGLGGTTDNQLISGNVEFTTITKGLVLAFLPRYSIVESPDDDRIDTRALTLALQATYRFTSWLAAVASYQFFHQRSDGTLRTSAGFTPATDADQNRVFVGVQFGYPIRFD